MEHVPKEISTSGLIDILNEDILEYIYNDNTQVDFLIKTYKKYYPNILINYQELIDAIFMTKQNTTNTSIMLRFYNEYKIFTDNIKNTCIP